MNNSLGNHEEIVNCLALTIKKDYNLNIAKNLINTIFVNSCRIGFSIATLNILSMFI